MVTKKIKCLLALCFIFFSVFTAAQNTSPSRDEIRKQMARIRQTTNWDDPVAAKKANEEIQRLSKLMMASGFQTTTGGSSGMPGQNSPAGGESKDALKMAEMQAEMNNQKMDILNQIVKSAAGGKGADILLAEPLREEIVSEYKEDDDKSVKSPEFLQEMSYLIIDVSMPGVDLVIDAMPEFKGIKHLVITSGNKPTPYNISAILKNASGYPLESLAIINFKLFLSKFPAEITGFRHLSALALFNNNIAEIPQEITRLGELKELYIDLNPIATVMPWVKSLTALEKLGIEKTSVSAGEIEQFRHLFPTFQLSSK